MRMLVAETPATLAELQLRVARRADELKQSLHGRFCSDRQIWMQAEFEVLEPIERGRPLALRLEFAAVPAR